MLKETLHLLQTHFEGLDSILVDGLSWARGAEQARELQWKFLFCLVPGLQL